MIPIEPNTLIFIATQLKNAVQAGSSIFDFLKELQATGIVPEEHWDAMAKAFDDANQFWSGQAIPPTDPPDTAA